MCGVYLDIYIYIYSNQYTYLFGSGMKWIRMCLTHAMITCSLQTDEGLHNTYTYQNRQITYILSSPLYRFICNACLKTTIGFGSLPRAPVWGCQDELMLALEVDSTPFRWQDTVDEDDPACRTLVTVGTRSLGLLWWREFDQIRSRKRLYYPFRP